MNKKNAAIDSSIDQLRKILGDSNNELSSEQQSKFKKGIRKLKRLKRATKLSHSQVFAVVDEIAKVTFEFLTSGSSK